MKVMNVMNLLTLSKLLDLPLNTEYDIAAILAGLIFLYLLYALIKAEKF